MSPDEVRSDCIFDGEWLKVRAMIRPGGDSPALAWHTGLQGKGEGQFMAACKVLETTLRSGRPPAGRAEQVRTSTMGLWELKVTKPGSTPPHLRMLFLRDGQTLWAATGFTKQQNGLSTREVADADSITAEWLEQHRKPKRKSKGGRR